MASSDVASAFAPDLLAPTTVSQYNQEYEASGPYKHAVIPALINEELLKATRQEIIEELRFAEKETDIYKVNQTGDLANLDGLPTEEAGRLQSLLRVRNAIYSHEFRSWLQGVTGCGPLSAKKKDMSINDYRQGCHLLNHDDVISTRRVSYILYLPDPDQPWQPEWGGALELYPVKTKGTPDDVPSKIIPPRWNQFTFFTVQPGHSFHSVEEVVHPSQSRLSISGWFHRPQEGEDGFTTEDEKKEAEVEKEMSSLESLSAKENAKRFEEYPESFAPPLPGSPLSQAEKKFLIQFLNPAYLVDKTQEQLFEQFGDDSHVLLSDILRKEIAQPIEKALRSVDAKALEPGRYTVILEPAATSELLGYMLFGFDARQTDEGRSFLSKKGGASRLGDKLFDQQVNIWADPWNPDVPVLPWDTENLIARKRMDLIKDGKVNALNYSQFWAKKKGVQPTATPGNIIMAGGDKSTAELIKGTRKGVLVTRTWYIRMVDPQTVLLTGLTRDGTFYIENGEIRYPIKNFRFNESPAIMLNNIEELGKPVRVADDESPFIMMIPPMKIRDFTFSSLSDAV